MESSKVFNLIKCSFDNDGHFAIEPILLSFQSYACRQCILDSQKEAIFCFNCKENHEKKKLENEPVNALANMILNQYLDDLLRQTNEKLKQTKLLKGMI